MKLNDALVPFFLFFVIVCTFLTAADTPQPKLPTINEVNLGLVKRMNDINYVMDIMLRKLSMLPDITREELESMMEVYVYMNAYIRMAEIGQLNNYLLFDILDEALGKLVLIMNSHKLSPTEPNQHGDSPRRIFYDQDIRPILVQRSNWMRFQLLLSKVPSEIIIFVKQAYSVQDQIISELKPPPTYYGDLVTDTREKLIQTIIQVIRSFSTGGTSGLYKTWKEAFDYVMVRHFESLRYIYYEGMFPAIVGDDLLISLAKLGIVFEADECNLEMALMTRESTFKSQSVKVETVLEYMKQRKSTAKIQFVDNRPFAHLHPNPIGIRQLKDFTSSVEWNLSEYWELNHNEDERVQMTKFDLGLQVIQDLIISVQKAMSKCSESGPLHMQGLQIMTAFASIIPTAHMVLLEVTKPVISPSFQGSVKTILETTQHSTPLRSAKAVALETAYSVIEAEIAMLHKTEPQKAIILYHFLELCRGIVAFWVNIHVSAKMGNPVQQREVLESVMIPLGFNDSMIIYSDCRDFLSFSMPNFNLKNVEFFAMRTQVNMIFKAFADFYLKHEIPKEPGLDFFIFVDQRIKDNMKHPLYRRLRGKIRPEMLKKNPVKTPQQQKSTHQPFSKLKKVKAVLSPKPCVSTRTKNSSIALPVEKDKLSDNDKPHSRKEPTKSVALVPAKPTNPTGSMSKTYVLSRSNSKPLNTAEVFSKPVQMLKQSEHLEDNVWANTFQRLMPTFGEPLMRSQIKQAKPKTITDRIIEKYEEPTHHAVTASFLGFVEEAIDPRDYLMALILIGERLIKKKFEPMLSVFQQNQTTNYLFEMFYRSIDSFEKELRVLGKLEPEVLKPALKQAGLSSLADLITCIKYYKMRVAVCHPYVPKSSVSKKNITARHLTTLDVLQTYDPSMLLRIRHHLECYDEIFVRHIETEKGRPEALYSSQYTDKVLAIIGLFEIIPLEDIRMNRNEAAHKHTTDSKYTAYVKYVFSDSPDYEFLAKI